MVKNRVIRARRVLRESGLDALLLCHLPNLRYVCGFTGTSGIFIVTEDNTAFLTDSRYVSQASAEVSADEIREYTDQSEGIAKCLEEKGCRRVGFEADAVTVGTLNQLKEKASGVEWIPLTKEIASFRGIKDSAEVEAMERAAQIAAEGFEEILPMVRPGAIEREIAFALEFAIRRRGGEEKAFDFIVASGDRGAMPHGVASDRKIKSGELVTIDYGIRFGGYHSDETVTLAVGEIPDELHRIYELVLSAHDMAIEAIRPGVSLRQIDAIARNHIAEGGYGNRFGHGLGHGIGLEVHEYPRLSPRSEETAEEGMVFTVEPGIYVPGLGGVRIEDTVVVTSDGCRKLTKITKDLRVLPL